MLELIWSPRLNSRNFHRYFDISGIERFKREHGDKPNVIIACYHYSNFEWFGLGTGFVDLPAMVIEQEFKNELLDPVFQKMLENATRICGAGFGTMNLYEEGGFRTVALHNAPQAYVDTRLYQSIRPHPASGLGTVEKTHQTVHIDDIRTQPPYVEGNPNVRA